MADKFDVPEEHLSDEGAFGGWWDNQGADVCGNFASAAGLRKQLGKCCWDSLSGDEQTKIYNAACKKNNFQPA